MKNSTGIVKWHNQTLTNISCLRDVNLFPAAGCVIGCNLQEI